MVTIIGVRFRKTGKVYYFSPGEFHVEMGDHVIVETVRGVEYGFVILGEKQIKEEEIVPPLKKIIRPATPEDDQTYAQNREKEKEAMEICCEKCKKHGLVMKIVDCEYTFDRNKILFYFTADGRVDFRDLVKDLASVFRTRIELRQIGVRDETKLLGGIGICGRELCCTTYLSDFSPVSVKMAKEQNLSLNPTKLSGNCGRLMCCLTNEEAAYEYLNSKLPGVGDFVTSNTGEKGEVVSVSVLKQTVKVLVQEEDAIDNEELREVKEFSVKDLKFKPRKMHFSKNDDAEIRKLDALEKKERHHLED
ncbi:MAG: stage 0 sporulation family protein [Lachnospiraceae bacterium]